jgi:DNA-binding transcriptional LysR family regulator|tara:strand:- start:317 stop:508 length:192 start_codon:yes stop_codon:yes gene_type:complete
MVLTELRYLVTLAQLQWFDKAAKCSKVNQSTPSIAVKKLEREWAIGLFQHVNVDSNLRGLTLS